MNNFIGKNSIKNLSNILEIEKVKKALERTPEHVRNLVYLVINNAEIRRFTSLGIINRMKQKGFVDREAKCYVDFYPNKYSISVNGLKTEYHYNNAIFINSLAASFPSFAYNADKIIQAFIIISFLIICIKLLCFKRIKKCVLKMTPTRKFY